MEQNIQTYERALRDLKPRWVMGMDEVGVGAWAGPVYTAAVLVPPEFSMDGLKDSKRTSAREREVLWSKFCSSVGEAWARAACRSARTIDRVGIREATGQAFNDLMAWASRKLGPEYPPCLLVVDGDDPPFRCDVRNVHMLAMPKADTFVPSVMMAANRAKMLRDQYMQDIERDDEKYARFGFASHKGYGTPEHQQALERHGITNEHRVSYRPVKQYMYAGKVTT